MWGLGVNLLCNPEVYAILPNLAIPLKEIKTMWIKFEKPRHYFFQDTDINRYIWINSGNFDFIRIEDNRHTILLKVYNKCLYLPMTEFNMTQLNKVLNNVKY